MIEAVIFDMDGLMIDSEPIHYRAFANVFKGLGRTYRKQEHNQRYVGISDLDSAIDMVKRFNIPISPQELVKKKQSEYKRILKGQVKPQPGLIDLLNDLNRHKYKKAVASSSMLAEIHEVIDGLKIKDYINAYCSAEEVMHGKPAPDLFLLAAERLDTLPRKCLVLEDGVSGVQAAKAAEMRCFIIPSRETIGKDFSLADRVLDSLSNVFQYLND